ncbi:MAG: lipoprotein-releasing ABC transporter permease subunit [Rickettsiales bacterium]|jgi:lipoprotein-releasing system permease protein|nr:lipoprotein-releasing ABC transporter permease subunit [Rickettsiales bacterium]
MFNRLERTIAFRYLRARGRGFGSVISWVSLLGIALGTATLIVVMSVMGGFHDTLLSRIVGMNGHVVVYHSDGAITDYDYLIEKMMENKVVAAHTTDIVPIAEGQIMISANGKNSGAMVRGVPTNKLAKMFARESGAKVFGAPIAEVSGDKLIMGMNLVRTLQLNINKSATMVSANGGTATAFGTIPRIQSYPLVSSFFIGMYEYDSGYVFMPLNAAQKFLGARDSVSHIDLFLQNPDDTNVVRDALATALPDGFIVRDWRELNRGFVGALQVESNVMFLILLLIVIVAAFNIISSLVMLVKDKSRDIAVLRTFGVSKKSMMKIFILCGSSIGVIGAVFGTIFGVLIAKYIEPIRQFFQVITGRDLFPSELYYLSELPSKIELANVAGIALVAILLAFLATLYPAYKAAKTDPVEVLRNE